MNKQFKELKDAAVCAYMNAENRKLWSKCKKLARQYKDLFGEDIKDTYEYQVEGMHDLDYQEWLDEVWEEDCLENA